MSQQVPVIEALVDETVSMINAFTVPRDESDRFLRRWKDMSRRATAYEVRQGGLFALAPKPG
jgi:hypothetical protein